MSNFKNAYLKELADQQVRFTPASRRMEQLKQAEQFLSEIDAQKKYPYQFVCFRITGYRPDAHADVLLDGAELKHDLWQLISELAGSMPPMPVESVDEPVMTLDQMSKRLNVSQKTINRWRKKGLIGLPILYNGRRQVGFLPSLVDPFLDANKDKVERSSNFSQLTEEEKDDILRRARRMMTVGGCTLTEVSRRIARRLGRSVETIRYTIKNYDREHPEQALFPKQTGPFDADTKDTIFNSFRRGMSVDKLAKQFRRTRSSMYRVINEVRAQRLLERPIDYIYSDTFDDPSNADDVLGDMPDHEEYEAKRLQMHAPKDVPPELTSMYEVPLLSKDQEQHLFRQMNFLKHRASKLRDRLTLPSGKINPARIGTKDLDRIDDLLKKANEVKDRLINANMRLVANIAKRHVAPTQPLFELLSDGNMSLMRAVEKFDYSRGFKFSTYASWAIIKNFARSIPEENNRRERYVTGHEETFNAAPDTRTDELECMVAAEQATHKVNRLLEYLDPREQQIVRMRAGLDDYSEGMTLEKIGKQLGITKERVRQLNVRAMKKLRTLAEGQADS